MSRSLVGLEPCGCTAAISVLTGHEQYAYKDAAGWAKDGLRIVEMDTDEWKRQGYRCADHPKGPPWWKNNGGNGKRPPEYEPQVGLGL